MCLMTCDVTDLILVTTLVDELVADLDPGLQQVLVELGAVDFKQLGDALAFLTVDHGERCQQGSTVGGGGQRR